MNYRRTIGFMILSWLALWGCSVVQAPSNVVWTAKPEFFEVDNHLFLAKFEPKKGEYPYYAYFILTITNKSDANLIVDWNTSLYMLNGKPQGGLVFEGIDPAAVKTATVPSDTIAPGAVFSREIMPIRLIAWSPIKEKTSGSRRITPGMLPTGDWRTE